MICKSFFLGGGAKKHLYRSVCPSLQLSITRNYAFSYSAVSACFGALHGQYTVIKDTLKLGKNNILSHELRSELVSERASERVSAAERASEESSAEQANERVVQANERTEERMAQYSTRRFHIISTQSRAYGTTNRGTVCERNGGTDSDCTRLDDVRMT